MPETVVMVGTSVHGGCYLNTLAPRALVKFKLDVVPSLRGKDAGFRTFLRVKEPV